MYYILSCYGPEEEDRAGIGEVVNTEANWQTGAPFTEPPPVPVLVHLNPDFPGVMVPMFDSGILLFEDEMVQALARAGVDNLDLYETIIRDTTTGRQFSNYKAANIIGTIAAANLDESDWEAPSGSPIVDADFDSLVIDEGKAGGALMFRLAECVTAIVIHQQVRDELERSGILFLDFTDPADWSG